MSKYFDKFPLVNYNGVLAKNLMVKADFTEVAKRDIYSNFDYVLEEGMTRPDMISNAYYNSPYYDWLIYLSNNIVDPYHGYYKSEADAEIMIASKYGSASDARATTLFYRNDWSWDDSTITEDIYDSLSIQLKKYWKPVLNIYNQVTGYERAQEDWVVSTNKIVELSVGDVTGYTVGDNISQGGYATIASIDKANNKIIIKHVEGEFTVGAFNGTTITKVQTLSQVISDEEIAFWSPVNAYDYEMEQNSLKKYINLIKSSYIPDVEKLFLEQMAK